MSDQANQKDAPKDPSFISTLGKPLTVILTAGGHSMSISHELPGTPTPRRFQRAALMLGAVPVAMYDGKPHSADDQSPQSDPDKKAVLVTAIRGMIAAAASDAAARAELFTNDGKPDARALSSRVGFAVTAADRDEAFAVIEAED